MRWVLTLMMALAIVGTTRAAEAPKLVEYRTAAKLPDAAEPMSAEEVKLHGYLGQRVANNEKNRLLQVDEAPLLAGFRHRPGEQAWIGEHVGKWLHAATLAWVNTGDAALREKLDRVVTELIKTQEPDGYLGTYTPDKRFGLYPNADWDVWVHKYDLIGLLTYYRYTGDAKALAACRKIGDLLIATFGPGKKSILSAGTHVGMAATSVLEPIVLLYRTTGDARYLGFAKYIVSAWDEPNGPRVLTTLSTIGEVEKTGNGKAYEMLSNLVGLCELARATGDRKYLAAPENAWKDIVAHQLYLTGSASSHEHFHADYELPNRPGANVGETCVTVTWIQLNAQLLRLTGEAKYGDELERSYYNHLAGAQRPDGAQWCYYTALEGTKPYGPGINCCVSSGPRGMALAPTITYLKLKEGSRDALAVNLFDDSSVTTKLGGKPVTVIQRTEFPRDGRTVLTMATQGPTTFGLRLRAPAWSARPPEVTVNGRGVTPERRSGWLALPPRAWKSGDQVSVKLDLAGRVVMGERTNQGRAALTWGPLVLAYDTAANPGLPSPGAIALASSPPRPAAVQGQEGAPLFTGAIETTPGGAPKPAVFVPFSEAGVTGSRYQVWLRAPGVPLPKNDSLLGFAMEGRSREGNQGGSITDGDPRSFVVTFDNRPQREAWFAAILDAPTNIRRVVFTHGRCFHDGGWFDTSGGKPKVQVRRDKDGEWITVGALESYPATTAKDPAGLKDGQSFTFTLAQDERAFGVRVSGKPASGDNPAQGFASCGELEAFAR